MGRLWISLIVLFALLVPVQAQQDAPWQAAVTGQIEAFRHADGTGALAYAGAGFQQRFTNGEEFLRGIEAAGYGPIGASRSHSFGEYKEVSPGRVMQKVMFVGKDQTLYAAVYELVDEPGAGWRVRGVVLQKQDGLGV